MEPILTVVVPRYDLKPILEPLGLLPELCEVISELAVRASEADAKAACGYTARMRFVVAFETVLGPISADTKRIKSGHGTGLSVYYGAFVSPKYGIAKRMRDTVAKYAPTSITALANLIDTNVCLYAEHVSAIMDVERPPEDFNAAFTAHMIDSMQGTVDMSKRAVEENYAQDTQIDYLEASMLEQQILLDHLLACRAVGADDHVLKVLDECLAGTRAACAQHRAAL